ncbi:MAG: 3D domain-containing protein [bacterium]
MSKISLKTTKDVFYVDIDPLPSASMGFCFLGNLAVNLVKKARELKLLNLGLLLVLICELLMPHKIFAQELCLADQKAGVKYQIPEIALESDVYTFNDKYVPEEIELQRIAAERAKGVGYKVLETRTVTTTAYSSTVDQCDDTPFIAASGKRVHDGMVAANFLKFNTKIRMPDIFGDKIFIVEDRMNQRFQNRVDIWMESRQEAVNYGARSVRIEILEEAESL